MTADARAITTQEELFSALRRRLERAVRKARTRTGSMREVALTTALVTAVGYLRRSRFTTTDGWFVSTTVLPYEQAGVVEHLFGDMAVIVEMKFDDGHAGQGVAYFENKVVRKDRVRFETGQPESYLRNSGHVYALYIESDEPITPAKVGLEALPLATSVLVAPSGLILDKRGHRPTAILSSFASHFVYRMLLGYDLDVRPGAVGQAFTTGAQYYLRCGVAVARELSMLRSLEMQLFQGTQVPSQIRLLWHNNEQLREAAYLLGMEPEYLKSAVEEIVEAERLSRESTLKPPQREGPGGMTR